MAMQTTPLPSAVVRMFGVPAGLVYRLDEEEVARRRRQRMKAVTSLGALDGLMGLPAGLPVAWSALTEREQGRISEAPAGAVEYDDELVVRRAVPPLMPQLAVVTASGWRSGLKRAGRFAPFCARAMLLVAPPPEWALVEASSYWGVGVCLHAGGQVQVLVDPQPHVVQRHTPARWWFAEQVYRQLGRPQPATAESSGNGQVDRLAQALSGGGGASASVWWSRLLTAS